MQIVRVPLSIGEQPSTESLLIWSSLREIGPKPTSGQRNPPCLHQLQITPLVFGFQRHKECIGTNEKKKEKNKYTYTYTYTYLDCCALCRCGSALSYPVVPSAVCVTLHPEHGGLMLS